MNTCESSLRKIARLERLQAGMDNGTYIRTWLQICSMIVKEKIKIDRFVV